MEEQSKDISQQISGLRDEYMRLAHAMQSGVAMQIELMPPNDIHKDLRVGVNSAMADVGGLATLLISKGVFTELEYTEAMVAAMRAEMEMVKRELEDHLGREVTLL